jgi:hypothetical protein
MRKSTLESPFPRSEGGCCSCHCELRHTLGIPARRRLRLHFGNTGSKALSWLCSTALRRLSRAPSACCTTTARLCCRCCGVRRACVRASARVCVCVCSCVCVLVRASAWLCLRSAGDDCFEVVRIRQNIPAAQPTAPLCACPPTAPKQNLLSTAGAAWHIVDTAH